MTTLLDCLRVFAERADQPEPPPEPLAFIAHPAWTEDDELLAALRGMQANGMDVRVQSDIRLPSVSLDYWLDRKPAPVPMRHSTYDELAVQAQRLVAEARAAGQGLPNFVVTVPELNELLRANGWQELRPGATFHGMTIRVLRG